MGLFSRWKHLVTAIFVGLMVQNFLFLYANAQSTQEENPSACLNNTKKRVLILMTAGGGGHTSVANAIKGQLATLNCLDVTVHNITKDKMKGEFLFDEYFNQEKWEMLHLVSNFRSQQLAENILYYTQYHNIQKEITSFKPDLIISVFPLGNFIYKKIAEKMNVPFMIITTDLLPKTFVNKIQDEHDSHKFSLLLPTIDTLVEKFIADKKLQDVTFITGYPIRAEFAEIAQKVRLKDAQTLLDLTNIKDSYGMAEHDAMVIISMGAKGFGIKTMLQFVTSLQENHAQVTPAHGGELHLMIACGSNAECLMNFQIASIYNKSLKNNIVLHPEGWLTGPEFAKRMAIAQFALVKPGGATVGEAMAMQLPLLMKADSTQALEWEKHNKDYILEHHWGLSFKAIDDEGKFNAEEFIAKFSQMVHHPMKVDAPTNTFGEQFKKKVQEILKLEN